MTQNTTAQIKSVIRLSGGLGNQMFQYAFGLAYSLRHKTELKFYAQDLIEKNEHNGLELGKVFNLHLDLATRQEIESLPQLQENYLYYNRALATLSRQGYYCGFWGSEKYFNDFQTEVREAFKWDKALESKSFTQNVLQSKPVGIHYRRGDYVKNNHVREIYVILGENYYLNAIETFHKVFGCNKFLVFSDDIPEAITFFDALSKQLPKGIKIDYHTSDDKTGSHYDMFLMSRCYGLICANSSFSWWAAKLNIYTDVPIVMPRRWFTNTAVKTADIYPSGCVVI